MQHNMRFDWGDSVNISIKKALFFPKKSFVINFLILMNSMFLLIVFWQIRTTINTIANA